MKTLGIVIFLCLTTTAGQTLEVQALDPNPCRTAAMLDQVLYDLTGRAPLAQCPPIRFGLRGLPDQVGRYTPDTGRITLANSVDLDTIYGQSVLLHEMVHAVQHRDGEIPPCSAHFEHEAYAVQAAYLSRHGLVQEALLTSLLGGLKGQCAAMHY